MFKCDKCGLCCKSLANNVLAKDLDRGDGCCKYLQDNLCSIYEHRPLICRVDEAYEILFKTQMSKEEYYEINYKMCNFLKTRRHNL